MLDTATIYGEPQKAALQPCSAWRSLASGPASRHV